MCALPGIAVISFGFVAQGEILGFDAEEENTWEPVENLDCEDKIKEYNRNADAKKVGSFEVQFKLLNVVITPYENNKSAVIEHIKGDHHFNAQLLLKTSFIP